MRASIIPFILLITAVLSLLTFCAARGDDHVIRPQCWEENVNGQVQRHCDVKRADAPAAPRAPAQRPLYDTDQPVPPPAAAAPPPAPRPYPGYQSTLPPQYAPGVPQQGRNWATPCTPYVCGYGSPYGYGYPPPYYYGPGFAFQFGPSRSGCRNEQHPKTRARLGDRIRTVERSRASAVQLPGHSFSCSSLPGHIQFIA